MCVLTVKLRAEVAVKAEGNIWSWCWQLKWRLSVAVMLEADDSC
jgi:hypothetical protein